MTEIKLTDEQVHALDCYRTRETAIINARAGVGKTFILREMARLYRQRRGLYLAYNKAIKEDAHATFPGCCKAMTAHGLAYRPVGHRFQHRIKGRKVNSSMAAKILGIDHVIQANDEPGAPKMRPSAIARLASETVKRFCWSADDEVLARHVPWTPGFEAVRDEIVPYVVGIARRIWEDAQDPDGVLRYEMDYYLKMYVLSRPRLRYDYVLVDEAQDLNPVLVDLVRQMIEAGTQVVIVGDPAQQLYRWRGAVNAMAMFPARHRSTLSTSFRFGPEVAEEANKWLELLDDKPYVVGYDKRASRVTDAPASAPDAVLCRTNGEVVRVALEIDEQGMKFALAGDAGGERKASNKIKAWADAAEALKDGRATEHPDLYMFSDWKQVTQHVAEEGGEIGVMVRLINKYGVDKLRLVARRSVDEIDADVVLSTGHGAKGREWRTVEVAGDFEPDSPDEYRLAYVVVTRGKENLHRGSLSVVDGLLRDHRAWGQRVMRGVDLSVFS